MKLLEINGIDLTNYILAPEWKVQNKSMSTSRQNANYVTRRTILRKKITGSFTVKFYSVDDVNNFVNTIESNRNPITDIVVANVYCTNPPEVKLDAQVYIDYSMPDILPVVGTSMDVEIDVNIEEA